MEKEYSIMYMHTPKNKNNKNPAVIVCPGGSYHHLGIYNEGYKSAKWFSENGFVAFNLRYRTAEAGYHYPAMLQDIQRAIQIVRENAEEFNIDASKVGIIGYSAGGHLVTMAGAFHKSHDELKNLGINHSVSLKPDFVVPVYPVVSMNDETTYDPLKTWKKEEYLVLHRFAVKKEVQRQGIASRMIEEAKKMAVSQKIFSIRIDTHEKNVRMRRFLEKNQFEERGVIYLKDGNPRIAYELLF